MIRYVRRNAQPLVVTSLEAVGENLDWVGGLRFPIRAPAREIGSQLVYPDLNNRLST
jgi:hypothetical protein